MSAFSHNSPSCTLYNCTSGDIGVNDALNPQSGHTALHVAALHGHEDACLFLIEVTTAVSYQQSKSGNCACVLLRSYQTMSAHSVLCPVDTVCLHYSMSMQYVCKSLQHVCKSQCMFARATTVCLQEPMFSRAPHMRMHGNAHTNTGGRRGRASVRRSRSLCHRSGARVILTSPSA